ncbi:MAG TPA: DUF4149 domain-containing protein [Spirochaetes bacterium]|nr:DUF4149 domain-containing protein [Spirochaetota bacterium]
MKIFIHYTHLLAIVVWVGEITFFSFVAAPAIFGTLNKEMSGKVVGIIFPKYYLIGIICGLLAIGTSFFMGVQRVRLEQIKIVILFVMLLLTLTAGLYILPKAREIKTELSATVEETKKVLLRKKFSQTHLISVILNVLVLIGGLGVLYFLALQIKSVL